jgi:hypothetical protein
VLAALPHPPVDMVMPQTAQAVFTLFIFAPLGAMVVYAVRLLVRKRDPLMLICLAGGALSMFYEPIVDVLGLVWFPRPNQWIAFQVFGRPIPLFIAFVYSWFIGGQGYLAYRRFAKGIDMRGVVRLWAAFAVCDLFIESPGVIANTYHYYGHQPFNPWGLPFWWLWVNAVMPLLVAALVLKLRPILGEGRKLLLLIPLVPMADGMANAGTAFPVWLTLNTELGLVWTYLGALASLGLAGIAVWLIGLLVTSGQDQSKVTTDRAEAPVLKVS